MAVRTTSTRIWNRVSESRIWLLNGQACSLQVEQPTHQREHRHEEIASTAFRRSGPHGLLHRATHEQRRSPGPVPVSYTHLDVYKRQVDPFPEWLVKGESSVPAFFPRASIQRAPIQSDAVAHGRAPVRRSLRLAFSLSAIALLAAGNASAQTLSLIHI